MPVVWVVDIILCVCVCVCVCVLASVVAHNVPCTSMYIHLYKQDTFICHKCHICVLNN